MKDLIIEKLVYGGSGLGFFQDKAVFLPYTAPGDRVAWHREKEKPRFIMGRCREVLEPSPLRTVPRCPHFGQCGGCQWQHLSYEAQVAWKEFIFQEIITKNTNLGDCSPRPLMHAAPWGYRARTRLSIKWHRNGAVVGFLRARSHSIVKIDSCPLMHHRVAKIHDTCLQDLLNSPAARLAAFHSATIETGDMGGSRLILECPGQLNAATQKMIAEAAADSVAGLNFATSIWIRPKDRGAFEIFAIHDEKNQQWAYPAILPLASDKLKLYVPPLGFYQVNLEQNRQLVQLVMEAIRETTPRPANILDLYCGMGNFSLPAAALAERVHGVDCSRTSISAARENARINSISNASFEAANVEHFIQNRKRWQNYGLVMLDPPRAGAIKAVRALTETSPPTIIYISCDPMTLRRDLMLLMDAGYVIRWSAPVDMFPQTYHIESVTVLDRAATGRRAA